MIATVTLLSALGLVGNGLSYMYLPNMIDMIVKNMINLKQDGMLYPMYMTPPFRAEAKFYVYEVTNPKEYLKGDKFKYKIRGPYIFDYDLERSNIVFKNRGETVQYDTRRVMYLSESKSAPDLDEEIWMINPIVPSTREAVASMVLDRVPFRRAAEPIVYNGVNLAFDNYGERLLMKQSSRTLFMGRKVQMLESITGLAARFGLESLIPPGPPGNMFGIAHAQNETYDKLEVFVGVGDSASRFGDVHSWKGQRRMQVWRGKCNEINGTNGELFRPHVSPGKPLRIFLAQLCRTFDLEPVGDGTPVPVQNGLMALEYQVSPQIYKGAKNLTQNGCYCSNLRAYDCHYDGLLRMGPCFFDAPLYLTQGNLKGVHRRIRSLLDGSENDRVLPDKQSFYLDPTTGAVLKANLTFTGLFKVVRQPYMRDLAQVQNLTYAPLFATYEGVEVPASVTWQVGLLQRVLDYHKIGNSVAALLCVALLGMKLGILPGRKKSAAAASSSAAATTATQSSPSST